MLSKSFYLNTSSAVTSQTLHCLSVTSFKKKCTVKSRYLFLSFFVFFKFFNAIGQNVSCEAFLTIKDPIHKHCVQVLFVNKERKHVLHQSQIGLEKYAMIQYVLSYIILLKNSQKGEDKLGWNQSSLDLSPNGNK